MPRNAAAPRSVRPRNGPAAIGRARAAPGTAASAEAAAAAARKPRRPSPLAPDVAATGLELRQLLRGGEQHVARHRMLERRERQPGLGAGARARAGEMAM